MNGGSEGSGGGSKTRTAPPKDAAWALETGTGAMVPRTAIDVLNDVRGKVASGELADYEPIPLGMAPLDRMLSIG